jgi:membrane fusion protein, macrolide-specific efflux system
VVRNKKIKWIIVIVVILLSAGLWWKFKTKQSSADKQSTGIITPTYGDIQTLVSATGTVLPDNRLELKPPIGGRVETILVAEGDHVKKGQTLAWLSSTERAALLDAARAQGDAAVKYWQEVYKPTPLISPIDGEVIVKSVNPGQTVTANDAVLVLSDRLLVKAQYDETDISKVKLGSGAIITLDAYPDIKVKAKVTHISYESTVVNNVTTYEVDVLPDKVPSVFRSGMSANVDVLNGSKENVLMIPVGAVKQDKDGSYVLLSQPDKKAQPVQRHITTGISNDTNIEITSGLDTADQVVIQSKTYKAATGNTTTSTNPFMPSRPGQGNKRATK